MTTFLPRRDERTPRTSPDQGKPEKPLMPPASFDPRHDPNRRDVVPPHPVTGPDDPGPTAECLESRLIPVFLWLRQLGFAPDVAWTGVAEAWRIAMESLIDGRALIIQHRLTWLHSTAYWAARNELDFQKSCASIEFSALDAMIRREPQTDQSLCLRVRQEVENLPPLQRKAIESVFFTGMNYREAAAAMGISPSTLRVHLRSAQGKLAAALRENPRS